MRPAQAKAKIAAISRRSWPKHGNFLDSLDFVASFLTCWVCMKRRAEVEGLAKVSSRPGETCVCFWDAAPFEALFSCPEQSRFSVGSSQDVTFHVAGGWAILEHLQNAETQHLAMACA